MRSLKINEHNIEEQTIQEPFVSKFKIFKQINHSIKLNFKA